MGLKKKLIQINTVSNTSTGKLMGDIQRKADACGYETLSIVGRRKPFSDLSCIKIGNPISFWCHVGITTLFDKHGYGSYFATKKVIRVLRREKPDIIHLHNLHGYYLYLPLLFRYIKNEFTGQLFWTFHDLWPVTGHCAHFTAAGCEKWKTGCEKCPQKKQYPVSLFLDGAKKNYENKKRLFSDFSNLTIVVPSMWMEQQVNKSFMSKYPIRVIPNGIDLETFTYRADYQELYEKYGIDNKKKILLGVASIWNNRKGLGDFLRLAEILSGEYQIVLVGLSRQQIKKLPQNITGIRRTENKDELVKLYSMAHIFVNPSVEESFSLVTAEALACGTPIIVLDTSAVKDFVCQENGVVLHTPDPEDYMDAIRIMEEKKMSRETIRETALKYDVKRYGERIMELYEQQ